MKRAFAVAAMLAFVWLCAIGHAVWTYGERNNARPSDCVIVLGAAVHGSKPSPVYEERIKHAIGLYQSNLVGSIIFTGGYGEGASDAESMVGAEYAIQAGIPTNAILIETVSRTTHENLTQAQALMLAASLHSAIIVSDPLHLKRAAKMAQDIGLAAVTSPTPTSRYRNWRTKIGFFLRELYFYHHYLFTSN